ncbi:MAG: GNAT family N-acetyltransferase [Clostridiales bacterium]|nr:GNAT family N-acetyltransferase [Clostridiales bacterium]
MIEKIRKHYIKDPSSLSTAFWKYKSAFDHPNAKCIQVGEEKVLFLDDQLLGFRGLDLKSFDTETLMGVDACHPLPLKGFKESKFFVLHHDMKRVHKIAHEYQIEVVKADEAKEVMSFINNSYEFISVTEAEVLNWRIHDVFDESLWIWIKEDNEILALGIAEYDQTIKEGALEWIQVHEKARGKGIGKILVNELLSRMKQADFVTVSGEVDNKTEPEKLYKKCGFKGNQIWYYYTK